MTLRELGERFLSTTKVKDLIDLLDAFGEANIRVNWKPVGGNDNNLAIINLGSDPAAGVIERTTNAIDSILELEWMNRGQPMNILSPRQAVDKWFEIRDGHLSGLKRDDVRALEDISKRVDVCLRDSDRDDRPTIDIRDFGIGIAPEEFQDSILSLNKNRKLRKLFLAGAFGQGGSTALAYSPFTLIASRKAPMNGKANPFSCTIVRFNSGDPNVDKHGVYEYMVDAKTGCPLMIDIPEQVFPHGTLVRHITMEIGKYSSVMTAQTGSIWFLTHNYLFDPVLPFRISDERSNKNKTSRTVTGNNRLLSQGEHTEYQREAVLTFRDGSVSIKWWVLSADGENARSRITQYVMVSKPIVVTYNGQKQGDFPNTVIKDELKLPYLDRYLVVHVDCDRLDAESRRQLFPTTREALRDTAIGDDLRQLVVDTLRGDEELKRLDQERKQRYIKTEDHAAVDNIRRRLEKRVKVFTTGAGADPTPRTSAPSDDPPPTKREPIPVQDPPTFLKIVSNQPRKVYTGRSFTLKFETDARPEFFLNPDNFIAVLNPPTIGQYSGTASVRDGYGVAYFKAQDDLDVGTEAKITLELRPPRWQSLSDSADIIVAELPHAGGSQPGSAQTPNINPHWVMEGEQFWADFDWNKQSVAKVTREAEAVDIYVSGSNEKLQSILARAQRKDMTAVDTIKNFYLEHVSFYALLEDINREKNPTPSLNEEDVESLTEISLKQACETVCGIIESLFEILANAPFE